MSRSVSVWIKFGWLQFEYLSEPAADPVTALLIHDEVVCPGCQVELCEHCLGELGDDGSR